MAHLNSNHNPHQLHHTTTPTIAATTTSNKFADIHSILSKTFATRGGGGGGLDQTSLDKPQQQQNSEFSPLLPKSLMDSLNDSYSSSNGSFDTKSLLGRQNISRSLKKPKLSEKITIDKANINKSKKRSNNTGLMKAIKDKKFIKVEELFASKFKIWKDVAEVKEQDSVLDYKRYRSYEKNLPSSEPIKPHHFENQDEEDQDEDQDQDQDLEVHRFEGNVEETAKSIQAMTNTTLNDLHYQRERGPEMSYFDHQELSSTLKMHDNDFRPDRHLFADGDDNENNRDDDVEQDFRFNESNIIREMERLKKKLSEEQLFQKQVSMLLREFYHNCLNDSEKIAKYCNELVHAHKCLLVSGEKQKLIQQEMQNLVDSQNILQYGMLVGSHSQTLSPKQSVKGDKGGETVEKDCFRRGCLAIRSVTLKLRNTQYCQSYFQNKTECFVLCLMEHKSSLMETPVLCINEAQNSQRDSTRTIVIDINEIFFELNQEFELILKFYFMFHPYVKDNENNWKQMLHKRLLGWLKKLFGRKATINGRTGDRLVRKRRHPLDISDIKVVSFHKKYSQDPPPLSSNFSLIGHIKLNIDNVNKQLMKLEQFNYCTIFEDEVRLDSEISYDYKFFN